MKEEKKRRDPCPPAAGTPESSSAQRTGEDLNWDPEMIEKLPLLPWEDEASSDFWESRDDLDFKKLHPDMT